MMGGEPVGELEKEFKSWDDVKLRSNFKWKDTVNANLR
jgi:hypothetical protein